MAKKIGICIKKFDSIFTNGCAQQGYFVMKSLRKAGFEVDFVSIENHLKEYDVIKEPVYNICDLDVLQNYSLLIFSSLIIDQYILLNQIKMLGIKIANLMVGNFYLINCEEFVFNVHNNIIRDMSNEYVDEIWLMPMYNHVKEYISCMTKKPVKIVPYVWDNQIINSYIETKNIISEYKIIQSDSEIDILIMEPNLSIHKTALPLLAMLNKYFLKYPNRLGTIHVFGKPKRNEDCLSSIRHLEIVQCKKVVLYDRTLALEIFHRLRESDIKYAILSTNIRNGLNFIHLECFTLNIPIIHNCIPFKKNGLFYEDSDSKVEYEVAMGHINSVWEGKYKPNKKNLVEILTKYHPYNSQNVDKYKELAEQLILNPKFNVFQLNNCFGDYDKTKIMKDEHRIVIGVDKACNSQILLVNLINLSDKLNNKIGIDLYVEDNIHNSIKSLLSDYKFKMELEIIKADYNFCDSKNIKLYMLSQTEYKYVYCIDQNTIMYTCVDELKQILLQNNSFVGIPYDYELVGDEKDKQVNYIDSLYNTFGRKYDTKIVDSNLFCYVNSEQYRSYFKNMFELDYVTFETFLGKEYLLSTILTLIYNKIIMINSSKQLVTNKISDTDYYPFGYSIHSDINNNNTLFINIDTNVRAGINLNEIIFKKYKKNHKLNVNNYIFRDIEYML